MTQKEYEQEILTQPFYKSLTFIKKSKDVFEIEEFDSFTKKVHPINSIPKNLLVALKDRLNKNEKNLFDNIVSSSECSEKTIKNNTLNNFVKECIQNFMNDLIKEKEQVIQDKNNLYATYIQSFLGPPFNLMIKLIIDTRLIPDNFAEFNFNINDFLQMDETKFVLKSYDEENNQIENSIGYSYRFVVSGKREDLFHMFDSYNDKRKKEISKIKNILFQPVINNRSTIFWESLDHFLFYEVKIAPYDRLGEIEGKLISRDTLKNKNHIVYIARDIDNVVRYIGEGKADRFKHVNSGVSHVYELNKEHFLGRKMDIQIYNKNLTKTEALSIERFLLNKYKQCGLWNKKDYKE